MVLCPNPESGKHLSYISPGVCWHKGVEKCKKRSFWGIRFKKVLGIWGCRRSMQNLILHRSGVILRPHKFWLRWFGGKMVLGVF